MSKRIISTSLAVCAALMINGCGGSDSDISVLPNVGNTEDPVVATTETPATGVAYYIDSAVAGINYVCGGESGITDANGAFTFEVGASCTFFLGDVELRSVDAEVLEDGTNVYETDVNIARILMSLDTDGNPDNGITLSAEIIEAIVAAGIEELPDTEEEMEALMEVVEENGGEPVAEDDAQAHLDEVEEEAVAEGLIPAPTPTPTATPTAAPTPAPTVTPTTPAPPPSAPTLTDLIVGKTVYSNCGDTLTFGTDGVLVVSWENNDVEPAVIETETIDYRVQGSILYTMELDENNVEYEKPIPLIGSTSTSISFDEGEGNTMTFYFTQEEADKIPATDCEEEEEWVLSAIDDVVNGTVRLTGFYDAGIDVTNLAVRIIPSNVEVLGLSCQIFMNEDNVTGSYGSSCRTWDNPDQIRSTLIEGWTFDVMVYRDDTDPSHIANPGDYVFGGTMDEPIPFSAITNGAEFVLEHQVEVPQ